MTDIKKTLAVLLTVFVLLPLGASATGGIRGLKSASTEHFDIIYRESSIETAALLYENCEDIYASLVEFFGTDPKLHIPVVVTSEYKVLNAYFTSYAANRIVMFDTVAEPGQLSNYPQTILYIFRHELTHAFQFNIRGPFMNVVSKVFGDIFSLSPMLYMYPSLSEGGAVLSESTDGYGRLNDSYAMQIVKQAKIEGLFPTWLEVAGARDTTPSGLLYYNFAGAFLEYLAITYGYDKVTSLYSDFAKLGWTTFSKIKKIFGVPVKQLWQDFYEWVEIPSDVQNDDSLASRPEGGSYYSFTTTPDGSVYMYNFTTGDILRFSSNLSSYDAVLNLPTNEQNLSVSEDGTKLLVSYVTESITELRLYSLNGGRASLIRRLRSTDASKGFRKGCFVTVDGKEYILVYSNAGQNTYLDLLDSESFETVEGKTLSLGYGVIASDFRAFGDGTVAMIVCQEAHDYIALLSLSDMSLKLIENPDDISIISLSAGKIGTTSVLSFTWCPSDAKSTNLSRYGEVELSDTGAIVRLSDADISGGVVNPLRTGESVLFYSMYFEKRGLSITDVSDLSLKEASEVGFTALSDAPAPETGALSEASSRYRPIRYFKDGILIPYSVYTFGSAEGLSLGLTWMTQDPTETYTQQISAGTTFATVNASYQLVSTTAIPYSFYLSAVYGTSIADEVPDSPIGSGDILFDSGLSVSKSFELSHYGHKFEIGDSFEFMGAVASDGTFAYGYTNYLSARYSYSRKTGVNPYASFGYSITASLSDLRPGVSFSMKFPRLMWWNCDGPNVTNLPFNFSAGALYYPDSGVFYLNGSVTATLYSREIQRAFPIVIMGLHFQRFSVKLNYQTGFTTGSNAFSQRLALTAGFSLTPVLGEYLTNLKLFLGGEIWTDFNTWGGQVAFGSAM